MAPSGLHNLIFRIIVDRTINKNPRVSQRLQEISGKTFRLKACDIDKDYSFFVDDGMVRMDYGRERTPDVVMLGDFYTFLKLFLRRADADSLFFSRRLVIKGDVKTSVFFKNLLEHL